jgi:hypothetical protein
MAMGCQHRFNLVLWPDDGQRGILDRKRQELLCAFPNLF